MQNAPLIRVDAKKALNKTFKVAGKKVSEFVFHANREDLAYYRKMRQHELIYAIFAIPGVKTLTSRIECLAVEIFKGYSWELIASQVEEQLRIYAY